VSEQGEAVAAGTAGGTLRLLSGDGGVLWSFDAGAPVTSVALSANGGYIAAGAGERAFVFRTADVPVEITTTPAEKATPAMTPTQAAGAGALIGAGAVAVAGGWLRRR